MHSVWQLIHHKIMKTVIKMINSNTMILVTLEERRERLRFGRTYKELKFPAVFYFRGKKKKKPGKY